MNQTIQVSLHSDYPWERIKQDTALFALLETAVLPPYFNNCRWFAGKARTQRHFRLQTVLEIPTKETKALLCMVEVLYDDQATETYLLPLSFIEATQAQEITPIGIIALAYLQGKRGFLIDALYDTSFQQALFYHIAHAEGIAQTNGKLDFVRGKGLAGEDINTPITSKALTLASSNSAMIFGEKYFMKLYRKLFHEANPEVEMIEFLTEYSEFAFIPAFAGSLTWRPEGMPEITLGMMQRVVDNQSDSWEKIGKELNDFVAAFTQKTFAIEEQVFDQVELLAQRTAEMHLALYAPEATPLFASEVFTPAYRSFLHKRLSHLLDSRYHLLIDKYTSITDPVTRKLAWDFMEAKELIDEFAGQILTKELQSLRVRILIYHHQLEQAIRFVKLFPNQPFVLDHIAKPDIKNGELDAWKIAIQKLALHENVYCKISGMVTEADWQHWKPSDFTVYLDTVVKAFGVERLMFGSDWPVCLVAAPYDAMLDLVSSYFGAFSKLEQKRIFGDNAARFYKLS